MEVAIPGTQIDDHKRPMSRRVDRHHDHILREDINLFGPPLDALVLISAAAPRQHPVECGLTEMDVWVLGGEELEEEVYDLIVQKCVRSQRLQVMH